MKYMVDKPTREQIVKLRKMYAAWTEIERRTGVPRRTAQLVFKKWQEAEQTTDLANLRVLARLDVASREFERHVRELIGIAHIIAWELDQSNHQSPPPRAIMPTSEHRKELLLEALRKHTETGVDWDKLDRLAEGGVLGKDEKQRLANDMEELRLIPLILATRCDCCPV